MRRRHCAVRLSLAASAFVSSAAIGSAQPPAPRDFRAAADSLRKLVESGFIPSVAFSVSNRQKILYEDAFGYADAERGLKATSSTAYPVASVAKSYTAIGALRAVDRGRLRLDEPVNRYLGDDSVIVPVGDSRQITARSLLHMTAGVPHVVRFHWPDEPADKSWDNRLGHFAAFPPGSQFYYSNQSLGIMGEVLARVSGKSFSRYMADEVFRPLGLSNTAVRVGDLGQSHVARAYRDRKRTGFARLSPEPGAGMYTSAHDLTTLARRVILDPDPRFLSAGVRRELTDFSQYPYYSTGWWKDPFRSDGGLSLLADGAALGHSASMKVLPAEGLAVAVLVNGAVPDGFTIELCDLLLRAAGFRPPPASHDIPAAFVAHPAGADSTLWGRWNGFITTRAGPIAIRIELSAGGMNAAIGTDSLHHEDGSISSGVLESSLHGQLPPVNTGGLRHSLDVKLKRSGDVLTGYVSAIAQLGDRPYLMIPYYVSLRRSRQP